MLQPFAPQPQTVPHAIPQTDAHHLVFRDGSRRSATKTGLEGAGLEAFRQAHGNGTASNYPRGLIELAEAETSMTGELDVLFRRDVQKQIAAQHLASGSLTEWETELLEKARKERRAQAKADGLPSRKQKRFTRLKATGAN